MFPSVASDPKTHSKLSKEKSSSILTIAPALAE